jgi:hypothetical protein
MPEYLGMPTTEKSPVDGDLHRRLFEHTDNFEVFAETGIFHPQLQGLLLSQRQYTSLSLSCFFFG